MKTTSSRRWRTAAAALNAIILVGCIERTNTSQAQAVPEPKTQAEMVSTNAVEAPAEPSPAQAIIPPANLSPGLSDIIQLAESGVSEEVLLAYVEKADRPFSPTVDEIVYLKDIGISDAVVAAIVRQSDNPTAAAQADQTFLAQSAATNPPSVQDTNGPSLTNPNEPTYSVAAETNFDEAAAVQQPQEVNINYFESSLAPYGNWVYVPDYGRCWQPSVVVMNRNWRPYGDRGHWVYTSSGWYWQSDYSWGWAPFHYGRWHCDNRVGWVWIPGTTWAPAWVSWRYTDQYCGWAPLPPSARYYDGFGFYYGNSRVGISFDFGLRDDFYTFVPTSRFCDRSPSRYYVHGAHSKEIFRKSVVMNNYHHGHNSVINEGVGKDRIARATHSPVHTVALREWSGHHKPVGRPERMEGNTLTVFRPKISTKAPTHTTPQRSVTTRNNFVPQATPVYPNRSGSVTRNEKTPATPPTTSPGIRREFPQRPITRLTSPRAQTGEPHAPQSPPKVSGNTSRPVVTTQPNTPSLHTFPSRNSISERSVRREFKPATPTRTPQINTPTTTLPNQITRQSPIARPQIKTSQPNITPTPRPQPSPREVRREMPQNNSAPPIFRSLPSAPSSFNRSLGNQQPTFNRPSPAPQPSVRQFTPKSQTPSTPSRSGRAVERNFRSERGRS